MKQRVVETASDGLITMLGAISREKGDMSYELHGLLRATPLMVKHLGRRTELADMIKKACGRFNIAEGTGLTATLAARAIEALIHADEDAKQKNGNYQR